MVEERIVDVKGMWASLVANERASVMGQSCFERFLKFFLTKYCYLKETNDEEMPSQVKNTNLCTFKVYD
jgi:hypothetical protein